MLISTTTTEAKHKLCHCQHCIGCMCIGSSHVWSWCCRGSAELLDESGGRVSPSESMTSIPTCMPFSWFGEKDKERDREPSSSTSSLPYTTAEASEHTHNSKNKVRTSSLTGPFCARNLNLIRLHGLKLIQSCYRTSNVYGNFTPFIKQLSYYVECEF